MDVATNMYRGLRAWLKSRPKLDVDESATWFLVLFVYAHGLTRDDLGFRFSGIIPQLTIPQVSLAMALLCLAVSVMVLIEPLLPSVMRKRMKCTRHSYIGQYIRRISILTAFILGLTTGLGLLAENAPAFSWLVEWVSYVGFVIFLVMAVKLALLPFQIRQEEST